MCNTVPKLNGLEKSISQFLWVRNPILDKLGPLAQGFFFFFMAAIKMMVGVVISTPTFELTHKAVAEFSPSLLMV